MPNRRRHQEGSVEVEITALRELLLQATVDANQLLAKAGIEAVAQETARRFQRLLLEEMHHRVKNTIATVLAITNQSLSGAASLEQGRLALENRLHALSRAQDILLRTNGCSMPLSDTVCSAIEPFNDTGEHRFDVGPSTFQVDATAVLPLTLSLNELCTNAVKYGALSVPAGRVGITMTDDVVRQQLKLLWVEKDGPPVVKPSRASFGSRLIERLAEQLQGEVRLSFEATGFVYELVVPTNRVRAKARSGPVAVSA